MTRPDVDTLACVNPACQRFRRSGEAHLTVRKVYGHDRMRLWHCRTCGEECSERRGSALFNTKLPEATAADVINHLGEGCSVRATARLVKVAKETVARLWRVAGRHATRFHDQHVHDLTPRALALDEQWSFVKTSRSAAATRRRRRPVTWVLMKWTHPYAD
jgi:transposase-like protein